MSMVPDSRDRRWLLEACGHDALKKPSVADLPPFLDATRLEFLADRLDGVMDEWTDEWEAAVIRQRLHAVYRDGPAVLERLYGELPGIIEGNAGSRWRFQAALEEAANRLGFNGGGASQPGVRSITTRRGVGSVGWTPDPFPPMPGCTPGFLVDPTRMLLLRQASDQLTAHDPARAGRYRATLKALWSRSAPLDRMMRHAAKGFDTSGTDPLRDDIVRLRRDTGLPGHLLAGEPWPTGPVGPAGPVSPDRPPIGPGAPGPWRPELSGRPGWLDLPFDPCDALEFWCRDVIMDATLPLPLLPDPISVGGIAGISPRSACAGETLTIHGENFGSEQPDNTVVVIGEQEAEIISWSDTEVVVRVPEGATSGCVGFRDNDLNSERRRLHDKYQARLEDLAAARICLGGLKIPPRLPYLEPGVPCTGLNRFEGGLPELEYFRTNGAQDITVEPGTSLTLSWHVTNYDNLTIRRTSAVGPTFSGATSVNDPPGGTYNLGIARHITPELWSYQLEASNSCGTVTADVSAVATANPALRVDAIEVSQGIQTTDHQVQLVRFKQGVIRVTPGHGLGSFGGGEVPGVTGRLRMRTGSEAWSPWFDPINGTAPAAPRPGASITAVGSPDRENTDDTLNFLLPTARARGPLIIEVELRVDDYGAPPGRRGASSRRSQTFGPFMFHQRARLHLRYVRITWQAPDMASPATPSHAACVETLERSMRRIPARLGIIEPVPGVGVQAAEVPATWDDQSDIVRDLVDEFDDMHNCSLWEWLTQWLGSDCPADDGAYWALITGGRSGGRAAGIPSNTYLTPVNDQNRAPHELGHSLGQLHIMVACPNGRQAGGGEPASAYTNNGQLTDVAFDLDLNRTVTAINGVWDIMTYCGTRWTKPQRSQQLFEHIGR
jgi:hypothetical protein